MALLILKYSEFTHFKWENKHIYRDLIEINEQIWLQDPLSELHTIQIALKYLNG